MKCPVCNKRKAIIDSTYGPTECKICRKSSHMALSTVEFTTDKIKEGRREYRKDTIQPYRNGVLSKEYLDEYGTQGIEPSKEAIKNARYVYKDIPGWWSRNKGKGGRQKGNPRA